MKRSTLEFIREARSTPGYSLIDLLHGYVYARWPYLYIGIGLGEHPVARVFSKLQARFNLRRPELELGTSGGRGMADTYHGKVLLPDSARSLLLLEEDIDLRNLEHVIPYPTARDIILRNPDQIVALECPCRASRQDPCLPIDVCMVVGEPFASFILEHNPLRSTKLSREEAIQILTEEHTRGHVHHAFFKDAMLGRFYAICNCCSCCCGAMQAMRNGSPMISSSGYVAVADLELCIGCESCAESCNFGALSNPGEYVQIDQAACMGCGLCIEACPEGALELARDPARGVPLEIMTLMEEACNVT